MANKIYARIAAGVVAEIVTLDAGINIASAFHASLAFVEITSLSPQPAVGWTYNGSAFAAPVPTLAVAQDLANAALIAACANAIAAGCLSSALGSPHTYPTGQTDQANLTASAVDAQRVPASWQASTAYTVGQDVMAGAVRLICTAPGTSGATVPSGPGADASVTWAAWTTPVMCASGDPTVAANWSLAPHSAAQVEQAGADVKAMIVAARTKLAQLKAQLAAAMTAAAAQAVVWS